MKVINPICIDHKPRILLLGNGINRIAKGNSWDELLQCICKDEGIRTYLKSEDNTTPMSIKAFLAANGNISQAVKDYCKSSDKADNPLYGALIDEEQKIILEKLLSCNFDTILTTNYSYEIECAGIHKSHITTAQLKRMSRSTIDTYDQKYLLHSYNSFEYNGSIQRVFHIHGEARKPGSIVLGSYTYERLLNRIIEIADGIYINHNSSSALPDEYRSWVDQFIFGDVYTIGFGFDFAENDIWWLIERKFREKVPHGTIRYYDVLGNKKFNPKVKLLEMMGNNADSLGFYLKNDDESDNDISYADFYVRAVEDILRQLSLS